MEDVRDDMSVAATAAIEARDGGKLVWNTAHGPAKVLLLSLQRVGWQMASAGRWTSHDDMTFDLVDVGGRTLRHLLQQAVSCKNWRYIAEKYQWPLLATGAALRSVRRLLTHGARTPVWGRDVQAGAW